MKQRSDIPASGRKAHLPNGPSFQQLQVEQLPGLPKKNSLSSLAQEGRKAGWEGSAGESCSQQTWAESCPPGL